MESLPDGAARALDRRIGALELLILRIIGTVALVSLVIGSFLPWITDEVDGEERTTGLATFILQAFTQTDGLEGLEILLVISFVVFDVTTLAGVIAVLYAMRGTRGPAWARATLVVLLVCCLVGCGLLTAMACLNGTEASSTVVHWSAYVVWALGAVMAMWVLVTDLGRRSVG